MTLWLSSFTKQPIRCGWTKQKAKTFCERSYKIGSRSIEQWCEQRETERPDTQKRLIKPNGNLPIQCDNISHAARVDTLSFFFALFSFEARLWMYVHDLALTRKYLFLLFPFMLKFVVHDVHWNRFCRFAFFTSQFVEMLLSLWKLLVSMGHQIVTCGRVKLELTNILTLFRLCDVFLLSSCIYDLWWEFFSFSMLSANWWCTRTDFRPIKSNWWLKIELDLVFLAEYTHKHSPNKIDYVSIIK